jgi:two-component sensor histidine kinase
MYQVLASDDLVRETRHRVKNSLQLLASMLSAQVRQSRDPALTAGLRSAISRIVATAHLHEHLAEHAYQQVDAADYLRDICNDLEILAAAAPDRVAVRLTAEHAVLDGPDALALGLSVNELVTNALRHAYPEGGGVVAVSFGRSEDRFVLTVTDGGVGCAAAAEGLGLTFVRALTRKIRGEVTVTECSPGTQVRIEFIGSQEAGGARREAAGAS